MTATISGYTVSGKLFMTVNLLCADGSLLGMADANTFLELIDDYIISSIVILHKKFSVTYNVHMCDCPWCRYQCDVAARTSTGVLGLQCENSALEHHEARHLGGLSPSYINIKSSVQTGSQKRWNKVGGLIDLIDVVKQSAVINVAQTTGSVNGQVVVPTYDWQEFFALYLKRVTGMKKLYHPRLDWASPGCVFVKEEPDLKK